MRAGINARNLAVSGDGRYLMVANYLPRNLVLLDAHDLRPLQLIVKTLQPAPGRTAAHVEFDREGRHALRSIWELDGAVVVFTAATLEGLERLPMAEPSGKHNLYNKITRSAGTSH